MKALILIDIQNDFVTGGALAVPQGETIIPTINQISPLFDLIVATQDWHPQDHGSFASQYHDQQIGHSIDLFGLSQILWPDHCIQHTFGAQFEPSLNISSINKIFTKGTDKQIDSYSGFFDNGHKKSTGLSDFLKEQGVTTLFIAGLALDYCVKYSAIDAINEGFETYLITDATKAVNLSEGDDISAIKVLKDIGVKMISSTDIKTIV